MQQEGAPQWARSATYDEGALLQRLQSRFPQKRPDSGGGRDRNPRDELQSTEGDRREGERAGGKRVGEEGEVAWNRGSHEGADRSNREIWDEAARFLAQPEPEQGSQPHLIDLLKTMLVLLSFGLDHLLKSPNPGPSPSSSSSWDRASSHAASPIQRHVVLNFDALETLLSDCSTAGLDALVATGDFGRVFGRFLTEDSDVYGQLRCLIERRRDHEYPALLQHISRKIEADFLAGLGISDLEDIHRLLQIIGGMCTDGQRRGGGDLTDLNPSYNKAVVSMVELSMARRSVQDRFADLAARAEAATVKGFTLFPHVVDDFAARRMVEAADHRRPDRSSLKQGNDVAGPDRRRAELSISGGLEMREASGQPSVVRRMTSRDDVEETSDRRAVWSVLCPFLYTVNSLQADATESDASTFDSFLPQNYKQLLKDYGGMELPSTSKEQDVTGLISGSGLRPRGTQRKEAGGRADLKEGQANLYPLIEVPRVETSVPDGEGTRMLIRPFFAYKARQGYEWTRYNQAHYDYDNPPPRVIQSIKIIIAYPYGTFVNNQASPPLRYARDRPHARDRYKQSTLTPPSSPQPHSKQQGRDNAHNRSARGPEGSGNDASKSTEMQTPSWKILPSPTDSEKLILRFEAPPLYSPLEFEIPNRQIEFEKRKGFEDSFMNNISRLHFSYKRSRYRK